MVILGWCFDLRLSNSSRRMVTMVGRVNPFIVGKLLAIVQSVAELVKRVEDIISKVNVNVKSLVWISFSFAVRAIIGLI